MGTPRGGRTLNHRDRALAVTRTVSARGGHGRRRQDCWRNFRVLRALSLTLVPVQLLPNLKFAHRHGESQARVLAAPFRNLAPRRAGPRPRRAGATRAVLSGGYNFARRKIQKR